MFKPKSPKFKLELGINELSNIPQVSGNCYIDLQIKDNKRTKTLPFKGFSTFRDTNTNDSSNSGNSKDESLDSHSLASSSASVSQGNVSVVTSSKTIHNFKCVFNYNVSCNLRFGVKRRENLIQDKYLLMKLYYTSDKGKESHHSHHHRSELGKLEINLAEYLNFNEPITSKYLLRDSKINSILSLTIRLSELPADFEFHTQLSISDKQPLTSHDSKIDQSPVMTATNTKYNVPQFDRKNVFGGLNEVIGSSSGSEQTLKQDLIRTQSILNESEEKSKPMKRQRSKISSCKQSKNGQAQNKADHISFDSNSNNGEPEKTPVIMIDPIVNDLYRKILESTWDHKLHALLEFNPEVCVASIFNGTFQEWEQKLAQELNDDNDENEEIRCINGLVNELNYRDDLKSWEIR